MINNLRARKAVLTRHHGPDSPEVAELGRQLRAEKLAAAIAATVASAPPLTPEQITRLRALLVSGNDEAA